MTNSDLFSGIAAFWNERIVPAMMDFIRIPNQSPAFDKDWQAHGHMERAVGLAFDWLGAQKLAGCTAEVLREPGRTPLLIAEIAGSRPGTVMCYGHLDKQPAMIGWREDLGPWTPVLDQEGRLFGRGGADDGYAVFAAVAAVKALQDRSIPHARIVLLIECSEESGSPDLPHYLGAAKARIGEPDLVLCLDSGCADYARLWCTTSLRGVVTGSVTVSTLSEGVHSGISGGIVPSPVRVLQNILGRVEDTDTGEVRDPAFRAAIPPLRVEQARLAARTLGPAVIKDFPLLEGVRPEADSVADLIINSSWKPSFAVIGMEGLPPIEQAGNVIVPSVKAKISLRIPPTVDAGRAGQALKALLEREPPHGAHVSVSVGAMAGWEAPALAPWLDKAWHAASLEFYGQEARFLGGGGSIPFMQMIGSRFPNAQFLTTGVLGPHSNAHGPNEFLHVPYATRLSAAMARVIEAHGARSG